MKQAIVSPRLVAIGGGTGLSTMLRGLKNFTDDITAIVAVTDNGGGSGILRRELGMPPPGDLRSCILALANAEPAMTALFGYRFRDGSLSGQSLGNLALAALFDLCPSFEEAVATLSQVLAVTGRVLPVSTNSIMLNARFSDDTLISGETQITEYKKASDAVISKVFLDPADPPALPAALDAIRHADMIILGPGSLYTSVIPPLLSKGIADAIAESNGVKVYVMNVMTQDGETEHYTALDHIRAIFRHSRPDLFQYVLVNNSPIPSAALDAYGRQNAQPLTASEEDILSLGLTPILCPLTSYRDGLIRHDPMLLGQALTELFRQYSDTKVVK